MAYQVKIGNVVDDEVLDTYEEAEEYACYLLSCCQLGAEILNASNPGDYEYDENTYEDPDYEIIEVN